MPNNLNEIVFILDQSGSMHGKESDVVGGYNSFIRKQMQEPGETMVTTVLFNDKYRLLYNGVPAGEAIMNDNQYVTGGSTALLDAVGRTILEVTHRITQTPKCRRPRKVIFVITTDGYENASRKFDRKRVKELITHRRASHDWSCIFLGADIDAYAEARSIGISDDDDILSYDSLVTPCSVMMADACLKVSKKRFF